MRATRADEILLFFALHFQTRQENTDREIERNQQGIQANKKGIQMNQQGIGVNYQGIGLNQQGIQILKVRGIENISSSYL